MLHAIPHKIRLPRAEGANIKTQLIVALAKKARTARASELMEAFEKRWQQGQRDRPVRDEPDGSTLQRQPGQ